MKRYSKLIILLCLFATSCEQKRSPNEQGLDGYNIKKNPGYVMLLLSTTGLFLGGCEGEAQRRASFFPEAGKESKIEIIKGSLINFLFRISEKKNVTITYTPIDTGCQYYKFRSFNACNGLFDASPPSLKCPDFPNFTLSDGPVICKFNLFNQAVTSFWGTVGVESDSTLRAGEINTTKCKISILIQYE